MSRFGGGSWEGRETEGAGVAVVGNGALVLRTALLLVLHDTAFVCTVETTIVLGWIQVVMVLVAVVIVVNACSTEPGFGWTLAVLHVCSKLWQHFL